MDTVLICETDPFAVAGLVGCLRGHYQCLNLIPPFDEPNLPSATHVVGIICGTEVPNRVREALQIRFPSATCLHRGPINDGTSGCIPFSDGTDTLLARLQQGLPVTEDMLAPPPSPPPRVDRVRAEKLLRIKFTRKQKLILEAMARGPSKRAALFAEVQHAFRDAQDPKNSFNGHMREIYARLNVHTYNEALVYAKILGQQSLIEARELAAARRAAPARAVDGVMI